MCCRTNSSQQTPPKHRSRNTDLKYIIEAASEYLELLEEIQAGVYAGTDPRNLQYRIPQSLVKAFQQIVMFFIYSSALIEPISSNGLHPSHLHNLRDECKGQCRDLLVEGKYELILMIHTNDYTNGAGYEAVTTEALMALVMEGLLNESSRDGTFDLTEIYGEYLLKLVRNHVAYVSLCFLLMSNIRRAKPKSTPASEFSRISNTSAKNSKSSGKR